MKLIKNDQKLKVFQFSKKSAQNVNKYCCFCPPHPIPPLVRLLGGLAGLGTDGMVAGWACWVAIWDSVLLNTDRAVPEADATPDDEAPCNFLLPVWYCRFLARGRDRLKGFVVVVFWAGVPTRLRRLLLSST